MAYREDRPEPIKRVPKFIKPEPLTINELFETIDEKRTEF
jgi:hypothetical protein|tara:strand:- start:496 stop:615 length:120 start_codon:yes stop_codon:yes gene_type:complete